MYQNLEVHMNDIKENFTFENIWSSVFHGSLKEPSDDDDDDDDDDDNNDI